MIVIIIFHSPERSCVCSFVSSLHAFAKLVTNDMGYIHHWTISSIFDVCTLSVWLKTPNEPNGLAPASLPVPSCEVMPSQYWEGYRSDSEVRHALGWSSPSPGSESGSLESLAVGQSVEDAAVARPTSAPATVPVETADAPGESTPSTPWPPGTPTDPYESDGDVADRALAGSGMEDASEHDDDGSDAPNDVHDAENDSDDDDSDRSRSPTSRRGRHRSVSPSPPLTFGPNHPLGSITDDNGKTWKTFGPDIDWHAFERAHRQITRHFTEISTHSPLRSGGGGGVSGVRSSTTLPSWERSLGKYLENEILLGI